MWLSTRRRASTSPVVSRDFAIGGPFRTLQTSLSLDNLADATVFDQCGLPQPGRLLRLQFRFF